MDNCGGLAMPRFCDKTLSFVSCLWSQVLVFRFGNSPAEPLQDCAKMRQFSDLFVMTTPQRKPKKSNRGRKKSRFFRLRVGESFIQLRPDDAARLAGVSVKTVYHWIAGTKTPSPQVQMLLEIRAGGLLPWHGWEGWRLSPDTGRLMAPNGYSFMSGELSWWSLEKALRAELQRENAALRIQLEQLRAQVNEQAANNLYHFPTAKKYRP